MNKIIPLCLAFFAFLVPALNAAPIIIGRRTNTVFPVKYWCNEHTIEFNQDELDPEDHANFKVYLENAHRPDVNSKNVAGKYVLSTYYPFDDDQSVRIITYDKNKVKTGQYDLVLDNRNCADADSIGGIKQLDLQVFLFRMQDSKQAPLDAGKLDKIFFTGTPEHKSFKWFFESASAGKVKVTGKVVSDVVLPIKHATVCPNNVCDGNKINAAITNYLKSVNFVQAPGSILVKILDGGTPGARGIDNALEMSANYDVQSLNTFQKVQYNYVRNALHEVGHILGLPHTGWVKTANFAGLCSNMSSTSNDCQFMIYGDAYEPLAVALNSYHTLNQARMGWLKKSEMQRILMPAPGTSKFFTIQGLNNTVEGVKEYRVPLEAFGYGKFAYFWVQYRNLKGVDARKQIGDPNTDPIRNFVGLEIYFKTVEFFNNNSPDNFIIRKLQKAGETFTDPYRKFSIQLVSMGADLATFKISVSKPPILNFD